MKSLFEEEKKKRASLLSHIKSHSLSIKSQLRCFKNKIINLIVLITN